MIKVLDKVGVPVTNTGTGEKKCFPAEVLAVFPPFAEIMLMGQRLSVALDTLTPWDNVPVELRHEPQETLVPRPMLGNTLPKTTEDWATLYAASRIMSDRHRHALEQIAHFERYIDTDEPSSVWIGLLQGMVKEMKSIAKDALEGKIV